MHSADGIGCWPLGRRSGCGGADGGQRCETPEVDRNYRNCRNCTDERVTTCDRCDLTHWGVVWVDGLRPAWTAAAAAVVAAERWGRLRTGPTAQLSGEAIGGHDAA